MALSAYIGSVRGRLLDRANAEHPEREGQITDPRRRSD
jgi:hypothetical protein